jgi:hypothetical protein
VQSLWAGVCQATTEPLPHHDDANEGGASAGPLGYKVVTFYWLTDVDDYEATVARHRHWVTEQQLDLRGRIYINQQGINAQLSGPGDHAVQYAQWVTQVRRRARRSLEGGAE